MRWCCILLMVCCARVASVKAQSPDTMRFSAGDIRYMVFKRDKKGAAAGPISYYDEAGVLRREFVMNAGRKDGLWSYYYPGGQLWVEIPGKDGKLHGVVRSYHPNGRIHATKPYRKGKLDGERVIRDPSGALMNGEHVEVLPYDSVQIFQTCLNGRPHGRIVVKSAERKVLEGNCVNGLAEGSFVAYDRNGNIVRRDFYEKGKFKRSEHHGPILINE